MIAIVDYGVGNLFSLASSLKYLKIDSVVTSDIKKIETAEKIILPGVGAFKDAKEKLDAMELTEPLINLAKEGKPFLGICLGMQLLFDFSLEYGKTEGLKLVSGKVCPLSGDIPSDLKVPQMGWNSLKIVKDSPILKYVSEGDFVYFVHSFYAKDCKDSLVAYTDYGTPVTAVVQNKNVFGTQFHPEKSGKTGLKILQAFSEVKV